MAMVKAGYGNGEIRNRSSFATHLLDTDIKYIKDLLGHYAIRTTERYLHVSKQQLVNIVSPFDDLWNEEQLEW
jgi:site-specific recombinase XerC